tara:strand:+ start:2553 stop:3227 length:675 start_codon:yes stop_codon:yes gene_type:complete
MSKFTINRAIVSLIIVVSAFTLKGQDFELTNGDLLFQDLDCGPFCDAIEKVTEGYRGAQLSHVGIAYFNENQWKVIEAGSNGVVITALSDFLIRSKDDQMKPKVLVGRIKNLEASVAGESSKNALAFLGSAYDDGFDIENKKYYCSELVYYSFLNQKKPIFIINPMTFVNPETKVTFNLWVDYFNDLKMEIPEGKLGLNPGGLSRSEYVEIVHFYGNPDGFNAL